MERERETPQKPSSYFAWSDEKRAKLTKIIALLGALVCLFYLLFDYLSNAHDYLYLYSILFAGSTSSLILLKYGKNTAAKVVLLASGVSLLSVLSAWETRETGLYLYYLMVAMGSVALFSTKELSASIAIGVLLFVSFYLSYFTDLFGTPDIQLTQEYIDISFLSNFIICLLATTVMLYYIIRISRAGEEQMIAGHQSLESAMHELQVSQSRFELAVRGSSVGIWDWDIVNDMFYLSPQLKQMLGYPDEKYENFNAQKASNLVHQDDLEMFREAFSAHLENHIPFHIECRFKLYDGSYKWVIDSGQAEWDKTGKPIRMVGTVVDIQDQKTSNAKLERQNKLLEKTNEELDRFVYSTSHDLKAPLSSISGLVNIALRTEDSEERVQCLHMIEDRAKTMNGFIAEIIDYSRNTRLDITKNHVEVRDLVSQIMDGLNFYDKSDFINFIIDIDDSDVIYTDTGRLKVILNNLISNAIKYHDLKKNGYVKISGAKKGPLYIIAIEDNGSGIDLDYHQRIFDMFYRASEQSQGSGLGLYIAKEMALKIDGKITFESEHGKGSTFYLTLPA